MIKPLQAIVKWPGGKNSESNTILPLIPPDHKRFIDPFVGGGAIYFAANVNRAAINDLSSELIFLYQLIQQNNKEFFNAIIKLDQIRCSLRTILKNDKTNFFTWFESFIQDAITKDELKRRIQKWIQKHTTVIEKYTYKQIASDVFQREIGSNLARKMLRMQELARENGNLDRKNVFANIDTAIHSAFYMYIRYLYNHAENLRLPTPLTIATYYYLREFCYSSMFRYNKDGKFNVPYGGMAYNTKDFSSKITRIQSPSYQEYLNNTVINNIDFETFLKSLSPTNGDFIFLDPPYDSDFSTYDGNSFEREDHERLAAFMHNTPADFLMVIKNTDFVNNLYGKIPGVKVQVFDKKYMVSFQNRNNKNAKHLIITNYTL